MAWPEERITREEEEGWLRRVSKMQKVLKEKWQKALLNKCYGLGQ